MNKILTTAIIKITINFKLQEKNTLRSSSKQNRYTRQKKKNDKAKLKPPYILTFYSIMHKTKTWAEPKAAPINVKLPYRNEEALPKWVIKKLSWACHFCCCFVFCKLYFKWKQILHTAERVKQPVFIAKTTFWDIKQSSKTNQMWSLSFLNNLSVNAIMALSTLFFQEKFQKNKNISKSAPSIVTRSIFKMLIIAWFTELLQNFSELCWFK